MLGSFVSGLLFALPIVVLLAAPAIVYARRAGLKTTVTRVVAAALGVAAASAFLRVTGDDWTDRCESWENRKPADCNAYGDVAMQALLIAGFGAAVLFLAWSIRAKLISRYGQPRPLARPPSK